MMRLLIYLILVNLSFSALGSETKKQMNKILDSYIKLIPYAYNGASLDDNKFLVYMGEFEKRLKASDHVKFLEQSNFDPNLKIIRKSVAQFKKSAKMKNFYFAKKGLKTIVGKCINCHSQLPTDIYGKINNSHISAVKNKVNTVYDQAMMAYLFRDYEMAVELFLKAVKENKDDAQIQSRSIRKILKISLMHQKSKKEIIKILREAKSVIKENSYLGENIDEWITQLKEFVRPKVGDGLDKIVQKNLNTIEDEVLTGDPNNYLVILHYMQGVFSKHLSMNAKSSHTPMALYWLGLIENSFHEDFMFSLGDLYLKKCIKEYSKSPYAKKCYKALESSYVLGFTGSSGTSIPEDIKIELRDLKRHLKN